MVINKNFTIWLITLKVHVSGTEVTPFIYKQKRALILQLSGKFQF